MGNMIVAHAGHPSVMSPFGSAEILVLILGLVLAYLTSAWSPLNERTRTRLTCLGIVCLFFTILPGLAGTKQTFLNGDGKPGIFYWWAFGLWFALALLRSTRWRLKIFGIVSVLIFGLALFLVMAEEFRLVRSAP